MPKCFGTIIIGLHLSYSKLDSSKSCNLTKYNMLCLFRGWRTVQYIVKKNTDESEWKMKNNRIAYSYYITMALTLSISRPYEERWDRQHQTPKQGRTIPLCPRSHSCKLFTPLKIKEFDSRIQMSAEQRTCHLAHKMLVRTKTWGPVK